MRLVLGAVSVAWVWGSPRPRQLPAPFLQGAGVAHRWVGPRGSCWCGSMGDSFFLGRGDRTGLSPRWPVFLLCVCVGG